MFRWHQTQVNSYCDIVKVSCNFCLRWLLFLCCAHHSTMLPWHVEKRRGAKVSRNRHDWYVLKEKKLQSKYETDSSEDMATQKYTFKHEGGRGSKRLWEGGKDSEREQKKETFIEVGWDLQALCECISECNSATVFAVECNNCSSVWINLLCVNLNIFYAIEMT